MWHRCPSLGKGSAIFIVRDLLDQCLLPGRSTHSWPFPATVPCITRLLIRPTHQTIQFMPNMFPSSLIRRHPNPLRPRRIVPHMLLMPALQLGNPIFALIQMKPNNLPPNPNYFFFHILPAPLPAAYSRKSGSPNRLSHALRSAARHATKRDCAPLQPITTKVCPRSLHLQLWSLNS